MNELHIKYKSETGKSVFVEFETNIYTKALDIDTLRDITKEEILSLLQADDYFWCISQDELELKIPSSYNNGDIKLYSDNYIEWLEDMKNR